MNRTFLTLLAAVLLFSGCSGNKPSSAAQEPAVRKAASITVYVDLNKGIHANSDGLAELTQLLKETVLLEFEKKNHRAQSIMSARNYNPGPKEYFVKIRIEDYQPGATKNMDVQYECTKAGVKIVKDTITLGSMFSGGKLARAISTRIVDIVDARIQGTKSIYTDDGQKVGDPKTYYPKKTESEM